MSDKQLSFEFNPPVPQLPQLWTADDIFKSCNEEIIALFKEDNRLERKRCSIKPNDLAEYFSMWGNTQPHGGLILVGVERDGAISGCTALSSDELNALETAQRRCPDARCEFKRVPIKNHSGADDFVVVIRVHYRSEKLVETTAGEAFVREGDQKRRLTETEKREIRLNKGELDCESETVPLKFPDDFDMDVLRYYREQFLRKRNLGDRYTLEDVMLLGKFGKREGSAFKSNLACAVLFAKDPTSVAPGAFIRLLRYDGAEEKFGTNLNTVFDRRIEGPLAKQVLEAERLIDAQMRSFTRLASDGRFQTMPEYPKEVWLEAVVNALVHRSYNLKHMNIFVKLFEDRMTVESPGTFLPPTTAATVYEAHNPRNPNVMWGLYYFDYVKCAFEGTRRMRHVMLQANLPPPEFSQKQVDVLQVKVTLRNNVEHRKAFLNANVSDLVDEKTYSELSDDERMLINYVAEKKAINVTEAALLLEADWRVAKEALESLLGKSVFEVRGGKPRASNRKYVLKGRNPARLKPKI
ncbi:MAG: ATP-binding protein [Pseudomonadota bacterium]